MFFLPYGLGAMNPKVGSADAKASQNLFYEITTVAAMCGQFYSTARFTLHVSGVLHTHHQEYNF